MAKGKGIRAVIVIGVAGTLFGTLLWAVTRAKAATEIPLYTGLNEVIYPGPTQTAGRAMRSIIDYVQIAYYSDTATGQWVQILADTILKPGMVLSISVIRDCVWVL